MLTPIELREQSHVYRKVAETETTLALKDRLTSHARALVRLADKIEHAKEHETRERPDD